MLNNVILFAQETPDPGATGGGAATGPGQQPTGSILDMLWPVLLIVVLGYFFLFRPAQRQESERKKLLASIKKGDEVLTNAGIFGTVVTISDTEDEAVIKVDEGTRLKLLKSCIVRNLTGEKAAKEASEKK
jgi:preprotein translocase subunit YajC